MGDEQACETYFRLQFLERSNTFACTDTSNAEKSARRRSSRLGKRQRSCQEGTLTLTAGELMWKPVRHMHAASAFEQISHAGARFRHGRVLFMHDQRLPHSHDGHQRN